MIPKAYKIKYSKEIETLKSLSLSDDNIVSILQKKEDFDGWVPITFEELKKMPPEKLKELKSYCWKDGNPRCDCIGITDVNFEQIYNSWKLTFSTDYGEPSITFFNYKQKIDNIGDGAWNYGLYKRKK
jgi:hypothetical protein